MKRIVALLCLLLPIPTAWSHGDASIPLFVAEDGADTGRCADPASPCRSIDYALRQAGKGTQIRVAAGRYAVGNDEDLFLLISGVVDVVGGYDRASGFATAGDGVSTLTGVPDAYRSLLRGRGFHVIADSKGDADRVAATEQLLKVHRKLQAGIAAEPCTGGMAGALPCENVDLLAHIPFADISARPSRGNDVWGFVDLNSGREYAIASFNIGTAVFDVTDPERPLEVGFVDGQRASWRDVKIYQHFDAATDRWNAYGYVTTDGSSDGLFVIDLRELPHRISRLNYPSQFSSAHNVYTTSTDFSTGLPLTADPHLIIAGSNLGVGQYRVYDLDTPAAPAFVSGSTVPNVLSGNDQSYMHDAASLLITDARKDSQCVNAGTACELLLDFNEEKIEIWDITSITNPVHLNAGRPEYGQRGYVHSGWWSEDRQFLFAHDELDEQRSGLNTTLRVFSLADLSNPTLVGTWTGPTSAIDHNGYVRGNRYYMSNYSRGLTVLDISNPAAPVSAGRLDTYPVSEQSGFIGAWGAYPFFLSGTIAISDINSGVYLARDRSLDVSAGSLAFGSDSYSVSEGSQTSITVTRNGGSAGAISVNAEVVAVTADSADFTLGNTLLDWANGDGSDRSIDISALADGVDESLESVFVRLVDPRGGATLANLNTTRVYIDEPGAAATINLLADTIDITERGFATAVVVLQRRGNATGSASVDYFVSGGDATADMDYQGATSGTITWPDGDANPRSIEFAIVDDGSSENDEFFELTLNNATGASVAGNAVATVTILDGSGVNQAPNAIASSGAVVNESSVATLDGSASNDPDGDTLTFAWVQQSGPAVTLAAPNSATTTFTAPSVTSDALLQFRLTVTDPGGLSDSVNVAVTVNNTDTAAGGGGSGGGTSGLLSLLLLLLALGRRRYSNG